MIHIRIHMQIHIRIYDNHKMGVNRESMPDNPIFAQADAVKLNKKDFKSFLTENQINWVDLLDYLKDQCGFSEDRQLCNYMSIPPSTLSSVRSGRAELGAVTKFLILDRFGYHLVAEASALILDDQASVKRRRAVQKQAQKIAATREKEKKI